MKSTVQPRKHTGALEYNGQTIRFCYWTHADSHETIDTVIFLGTGQSGKIPQWVAALAPPGVAVVEGLPHWKAHPGGEDLKDFSELYTRAAFQTILKDYKLRSVHVVAVSQAAPGALWMATKVPEKIRNISLVVPLGLTGSAFGSSETARLRELKKRALRTMLQPKQSPMYGPRNFYAFLSLLRVRFLETERGASDRKYGEGLSHNLLEECRLILTQRLARHARFYIFLGGKDVIFPYAEVHAALNESGLDRIETILLPKTSHTSFATSRDRSALHQIVATTRS